MYTPSFSALLRDPKIEAVLDRAYREWKDFCPMSPDVVKS
jgi:hypothetical protein